MNVMDARMNGFYNIARATLMVAGLLASFMILFADCARAQQRSVPREAYVGDMQIYITRYEDTLIEIARDFNLGFNELRSANPFVDSWMPGARKELIIPARHLLPDVQRRGIVINLPEMRLYMFDRDGLVERTHPIGVGREGLSTPLGSTTVTRKIEGPTWRPTARMRREDPKLPAVVPPGPNNPMGTHAIYLGWPSYAIHGTDKPYGIGRRTSSGCIRMYPEDIVDLYPQAGVGSRVTVLNQPVKAAWIDGRFYVEAHPPLDQANEVEETGALPRLDLTHDDMRIILKEAGADADLLDWSKIREVVRRREGYPIAVAARPDALPEPRLRVGKRPSRAGQRDDNGPDKSDIDENASADVVRDDEKDAAL